MEAVSQGVDKMPDTEGLQLVFERHLPELLAVPENQVLKVNVDVVRAIVTTLGVVPKLKTLRSELEQYAPGANFAWLDNLENYALVLHYAHGDYLVTPEAPASQSTTSAAQQLRSNLRAAARGWAQRGRIEPSLLQGVGRTPGFKALARDLGSLVRIFRNSGLLLSEHTLPSESELLEAQRLEAELIRLEHGRSHCLSEFQRAADLQARAFTLLQRAYREARNAVIWVRRAQGDANKIIPSLYRQPTKRRKRPAAPTTSLKRAD